MFHQETFLSSPEWINRAWTGWPKTPYDEINDSLFHLANILQRFDAVARDTDPSAQVAGFRKVIAEYEAVESTLQDIYEAFQQSVSGQLYWPALPQLTSPVDDSPSGRVFIVAFHFPNLFVAQVVATYWSATMTVHAHLMHSHALLAAVEAATGELEQSAASAEQAKARDVGWRRMAANLCQSGEYFMQPGMGSYGPLLALTFFSGCYSCYFTGGDGGGRELLWVADMMARIKTQLHLPLENLLM